MISALCEGKNLPLTVLAYEHTGNIRVAHYVEAGDLIDWKRAGERGSRRCKVLKVWRLDSGRTMLRVEQLTHDGRTINRHHTNISRGILAVYKPDGQRKDPVRQ